MNAEYKAKWIAALRSGKYKQATGRLNTGVGMCCLGVACDIVDPTAWVAEQSAFSVFDYNNESNANYPPQSVWRTVLDLPNCNPVVVLGLSEYQDASRFTLSDLNDSGEFTFDQIADLIQYAL